MARIASHCETVLLDDLSSRNRSEHTTKNTRHMQRTNQERRGHNTRTSPHDRQRFRWKGKGSKGTLPKHAEDSRRLLSNQEDFIRLIFKIGEVADYAQGIGYRLSAVIDRNWKVDKKYTKRLAELNALVLEEMSKIRETVMSLGFNPTKAMELSRGVEETEKKVDMAYRSLDLDVLDEKIPLRTLLLVRDLSAHMENMADLGVDVVDLIRVI